MNKILKLPIMLVMFFVAFMFILDITTLKYTISVPKHIILAITFFVFGFLIIVIGGYSFKIAKTTVNPMTPEKTTQLVIRGIYNYSRNPMYIGFLLWLIACMVYLGNVANLLLLPLYIILVNRFYIVPEEKALEKLFENEFLEYKNNVRRWI